MTNETVAYIELVGHKYVHVLTLVDGNHRYSDEQRKVGQLSLLLDGEWVVPAKWNFVPDHLEDGAYLPDKFILHANEMHEEIDFD
ncbi:hypothetical protein [Alteromonas sp. BMJM2]|uniref:hypothetical protein n=1 Tax=Alteromonas sp. BMJM2 TaxID=2954241 RepID=UPI0022B5620F|nr:hypothetical protein [Alteromonas sp. BMJM2]